MPICINNSVLYIKIICKKVCQSKVIPYCFFHTRPRTAHLHNLTQKSDVLLINGKGYAKENEDCRVGLYSNKQISYQGQPKVIAKFDNSSSYIFTHLVVIQSKLSSAKKYFIQLKHPIHSCTWAYIFSNLRVKTNIDHNIMVMAKAAVPNGTCIVVVKLLECKLRTGLMYPCGTYVRKMYSTFSVLEVKMTLTVYGSLSYLALELLPYYDKSY